MKPRGEELIANGKDRSSGKDAARTCLALALVLVSSHVLNADIFPTVAQDLPAAREISTYGGVAFPSFWLLRLTANPPFYASVSGFSHALQQPRLRRQASMEESTDIRASCWPSAAPLEESAALGCLCL